jgi:hypothetical protein
MKATNKTLIVIIVSLYTSISFSHDVGTPAWLRQDLQGSKQLEAQCKTFFDTNPTIQPASYVYSPGILGTEILMGRYCPYFVAQTGERITWRSGGHIIGQPHSAVTFPEINLNENESTWNPVKIVFNRVRQQVVPIVQQYFQKTYDFSVENNPNSSETIVRYRFNFSQGNLAQTDDINALTNVYQEHVKKYPSTNVILFGDSRGAATTFNFIAQHKPSGVKAAILEGIFDTVPHCIKHLISTDKNETTEQFMHILLCSLLGSYDKNGPTPRLFAEEITDDIPLLFVTSLKDGLVPPQGTMSLYNRLKERGFKKVHLLVLKKSIHPCYMISDEDDKKTYGTVVHAFYKHYGLPHNASKAAEGQTAFAQTQPAIALIEQSYKLPVCTACYCNGK